MQAKLHSMRNRVIFMRQWITTKTLSIFLNRVHLEDISLRLPQSHWLPFNSPATDIKSAMSLRHLFFLESGWVSSSLGILGVKALTARSEAPNGLSSYDLCIKYDYCDNYYRCMNRTVDLTPACWDHLGITQYLEDWWNKHGEECNSPPYKDQGFASCYQQKLEILNYPCNNISASDCYHPSFHDNSNTDLNTYYVLYAISGIWNWYNSIWLAAQDATLLAHMQASEIIDAIRSDMPNDEPLPGVRMKLKACVLSGSNARKASVSTLAAWTPKQKFSTSRLTPIQHTSIGVLLSLLSAGLAFVSFPASTAGAKIFTTSLQQTPGVAKALLDTGPLGKLVTPLDEIDSYLGDILQQFQVNLANALNVTQSEYSHFISSVANGSFVRNQPSLNLTTSGLTRLYKTFIGKY